MTRRPPPPFADAALTVDDPLQQPPQQPQPIPATGTLAPSAHLVAVARSQLSYTASPTGWSIYGDWWARSHRKGRVWTQQPWSGMFVAWCAAQARVGPVVGDFAHPADHAAWFTRNGRWHPGTAGIAPADIVFFNWAATSTRPVIDHVGIVEAILPGGVIRVIEGDTLHQVLRRDRAPGSIAGYGRPAYPTTRPQHRRRAPA